MREKFYFKVIIEAETDDSGYFEMSREDAEYVCKLFDTSKWLGANLNNYSGSVSIEIDYPMPAWFIEYVDKHYNVILTDLGVKQVYEIYQTVCGLINTGIVSEEAIDTVCKDYLDE